MKVVVKGLNYTEIITTSKNSSKETVQFYALEKLRKKEDCGVWRDGKKITDYTEMKPQKKGIIVRV